MPGAARVALPHHEVGREVEGGPPLAQGGGVGAELVEAGAELHPLPGVEGARGTAPADGQDGPMPSAPAMEIDPDAIYEVTIATDQGDIATSSTPGWRPPP